MRIGYNGRFLAASPGGVQRFALEVLRRAVPRAEVTLFVPRGVRPPEWLAAAARIVEGTLSGPAWEQLELPGRARRAGVDVVLHPANAAPLWGGPNVVVLHDLAPLNDPESFRLAYRLWARVAHARAAMRAERVVTVSNWSKGEIVRRLGLSADRVTVVRQGAAPLDAPATPEAVDAVRRARGLPSRYFLATTGGDPRKGEAFLREVWRGWPAGTAPQLAIVGNHYDRVHANGGRPEEDSVRVLGYVPDEELRALYTGAAALVYPSRLEGFGRPPVEALACGTRVMTTPYGPASEMLGGVCDLVPPDADSWRTALTSLLDEANEVRASRVAEGRRFAAAFDWQEAVCTLLDVCRDAAGAAP